MKKRSNRLEQEFVDTAMLFFGSKPWDRFPMEVIFLISLPTEEHPLVASFMGMGDDQAGLTISRGEGALERYIEMGLSDETIARMVEQSDMFCVCYDYWRNIPQEFRRTVQDSGKSFSRNAMAPIPLARKPYEANRVAGRADLRNLVLIMRGVMQAEAAGQFAPLALDPVGRLIFQLHIDGKPKHPTTTTSTVAWPQAIFEVPALAMLPQELEHLPRGTDCWLIGRLQMPPMVENDNRNSSLFMIAVENGPILATVISQGDDLSEAIELIAETMQCESPDMEHKALPQEILFNDERLFGAFTPALSSLSIQANLDVDASSIDGLFESLLDSLSQLTDHVEGDGVAHWESVEGEATQMMVALVRDKALITDRALTRYFGDPAEAENILLKHGNLGPYPSLMEWFIADY